MRNKNGVYLREPKELGFSSSYLNEMHDVIGINLLPIFEWWRYHHPTTPPSNDVILLFLDYDLNIFWWRQL